MGDEVRGGGARIPTKEELLTLPRWARVAFAARCARRVQPMFLIGWPGAPVEHIKAVEDAITIAETLSASPSPVNTGDGGNNAHSAAYDASVRASAPVAALAALSASDAALTAVASTTSMAGDSSARAADGSSRIAAVAGVGDNYVTANMIATDFGILSALAASEGWTDETAVPVDLLGPLWAEGEPEGWPEDPKAIPKPFLMAIDPGEADAEDIQEVLAALSDLHEAHTGYALDYHIDGALIHAHAEVCV